MKRMILMMLVVLVGCTSYRPISKMTPEEKEKIDDILSQRKLCIVNEIQNLDDGKTDIEYVKTLVSWKCDRYAETIKDTLFNEFKIELGDSWLYSNDIRQSTSNEVTEALIMKRKAMQEKEIKSPLLRPIQ